MTSSRMSKNIGRIGKHLKARSPFIYFKLKPYFPDKQPKSLSNNKIKYGKLKTFLNSFGIKKIYFYNHWHNGDIHHAREFIKYIIKSRPNYEYAYLHYNSERLLLDIPQVKYLDLNNFKLSKDKFITKRGNCLFINTWMGQNEINQNRKAEDVYEDLFKKVFSLLKIPYPIANDWCPEINYSFFSTPKIQEFISSKKNLRVLISNGNVLGGQSYNFSFVPVVEALLDKFKNIDIILTEKTDLKDDRIFYTEDITDLKKGDLPEISLIATSADIIIGRDSGPFVYCLTKQNYSDASKTFIIFVPSQGNKKGIYNGPYFMDRAKAEIVFSGDFDFESVVDIISNIIKNK